MRHGDIIKKVNNIFLNEFKDFIIGKWVGNIRLDSTEEVKDKKPYVSINYMPESSDQRFLYPGDYNLQGTLRVYFYEQNPTKSMELLDIILEFLKNKTKEELIFTELPGLGSPFRNNAGDLYVSFIDFKACLIH